VRIGSEVCGSALVLVLVVGLVRSFVLRRGRPVYESNLGLLEREDVAVLGA
jgi:hypothetical protein